MRPTPCASPIPTPWCWAGSPSTAASPHWPRAYEIPIAPHGLQEIHIHLLAAFPFPLILEYYNPNVAGLNEVMFHEKLELTDRGTVMLPQGPGLGVEFNSGKRCGSTAEE